MKAARSVWQLWRRIKIAILLGSLGIVAGSCVPPQPPEQLAVRSAPIPNYTIVARCEESTKPVEGCQVFIPELHRGAISDALGLARIESVPVGLWRVRWAIPGALRDSVLLRVSSGKQETLRVFVRFEHEDANPYERR